MNDIFTGSTFAGMNGLRVSANPFGGPNSMPAGEDLPGAARVAEDARPREAAGPKRPRAGLLPMRPGAQYAITIKRAQMDRTEAQKKLAQTQRALRGAMQKEHVAKEAATAAAPSGSIPPDLVTAYTKAANERATLQELYSSIAKAAGRNPHEVVCCVAQDPALMGEAFADPDAAPVWICTHEKCRGQEWTDHRGLQVDHPAADLSRKGEAHVYGLWSKVAIDPEAPVIGVLGLIAPFSSDGTPVTKIAAAFAEQMGDAPEDDDEPVDVDTIRAEAERRRLGRKAGEAS